MIKTILWGFCGENGKKIAQQLRDDLNIIKYFSDQENSIDIWPLLLGDIPEAPLNSKAVQLFSEFHQQHFETYQIMITRRGLHFSDYHELNNEFSLSFHYFFHLLSSDKPELVIFSNLPHEGPDFVLYNVAKLLGLKTLMCYQSIFPNKFFYCTKLDDFGQFKNSPAIFQRSNIDKELTEKPKLFYMKSVEKRQAQEQANTITKLKYKASNSVQFAQAKLQRLNDLKDNPKALNLINLSKKLAQKQLSKQYQESLKEQCLSRVKLNQILESNQKIVYFPLHLQPELTTSALGGIFQDQIHALEALSKLLDDDWIILVKENPKQTAFQRRELFFKRLNNIPNTYLVDNLFPSQTLMDKALLVATITGTAGWEAIKSNKKCLVFGLAWYSSLENCLIYNSDLNQKSLMSFLEQEVSFDTLKVSLERLNQKAGQGVIDGVYSALINEFDLTTNGKQTSKSLCKIIQHSDTQW